MFLWKNKKNIMLIPCYLELCRILRKTHLGQLAKAGLNNRVVLFPSGVNCGLLLYLVFSFYV